MKSNQKKFMTVLMCELCGKEGAGWFHPANSIETQLQNKNSKGFVDCGFHYGPVANGFWCLHCEGCRKDSATMLDLHAAEKEQFQNGQSWDLIVSQRHGDEEGF